MHNITFLPPARLHLLEKIVSRLRQINGISAIVLGGSYAEGTQQESSDFDIGIYYHPERPFLIDDIHLAAETLSEGLGATVTDFYEWGAWVNGGAWIQTPLGKVDFLYRNLEQIQKTIDEACQGIIHHDYDQQPSNGFYSVIYLAETLICIPLFDPDNQIAALKQQVEPYPSKLKQKTIQDHLWSAEFTLLFAQDFAEKSDIYNVAACLSRVAANLTQALFALNETYFFSEKRLSQSFSKFQIIPDSYNSKLMQILSAPGSSSESLLRSVEKMKELWNSVIFLTEGRYQPKFSLP